MELTPGQRKAVFAAVVLALAALGAFLFLPGSLLGSKRDQGQPAASSQTVHHAASSPQPTGGGLGAPQPPAPPDTSGVNIYQWLPFTRADLAAAANVVTTFTTDYVNYSYTESAASYVGRMNGLITQQLAGTLQRAYATPGVAQLRTQQKQVYSGTVRITGLRAFGQSSMIFVVAVAQKVTGTKGTSRSTVSFAVTVAGAQTHWQVNDVEPAAAGNT
jgi:hypothetical protein